MVSVGRGVLGRRFPKGAYALTILLFLLFFVAGYSFAEQNPSEARRFFDQFKQFFEPIAELDPASMVLLIFINNSIKTFLAMVGGLFFSIIPLVFVASNGALLGLVSSISAKEFGWVRAAWLIAPHGIIEIPTVLAACAYGIWLGYRLAAKLLGAEDSILRDVASSLGFFFRTCVPLLFVAAFIEVLITPVLAALHA